MQGKVLIDTPPHGEPLVLHESRGNFVAILEDEDTLAEPRQVNKCKLF